MREIIITSTAMIIIFLLSIVVGRLKSKIVAVAIGVFLTVLAGFGGYFARTWEFRQRVLEWVTPSGHHYVSSWGEQERLFHISVIVVACMILLAALCVCVDEKTKSIISVIYIPAMMLFVMVFSGTSSRGAVNSFNDVSENVVSEEVLYHVGDELNFEIGGIEKDKPIQWTSITTPSNIDSLEKNFYWRVTKNEVASRIDNVYRTEYNYVGVGDDIRLFEKWVRVSGSQLQATKITRKIIEVVSSSKHYPDITTIGKRYYMVVDLEPADKDWKSKFDEWRKTVDELERIAQPRDKEKN